jgi:murein DD-endopeptidase MepM/ murein hydrolase activator NlpD
MVGLVSAAFTVPTAAAETWLPPVHGPVARSFQAPVMRYGRGHLGVDFAAAPGSAVRAVGAGTVEFAGVVAGVRHVVVRHAGDLRTSYSFLASVRVRRGQRVGRGTVLGTSGGHGENHGPEVVHLGLRVGDTFVDPMRLFTPVDLSSRVHLAPEQLGSRPDRSVRIGPRWPSPVAATLASLPDRSGGVHQLFARS